MTVWLVVLSLGAVLPISLTGLAFDHLLHAAALALAPGVMAHFMKPADAAA